MVNSVVVVLGAAVNEDGTASPCMVRRCLSGCAIARELDDADILFCGGKTKANQSKSEAEVMADYALTSGFPASRIYKEETSTDTLENAAFSSRIIVEKGWDHVIVVSDHTHLLRAWLSFKACGVKAGYRAALVGPKAGLRGIFSGLREVPALLWYGVRVLNGHPNLLMTQVK